MRPNGSGCRTGRPPASLQIPHPAGQVCQVVELLLDLDPPPWTFMLNPATQWSCGLTPEFQGNSIEKLQSVFPLIVHAQSSLSPCWGSGAASICQPWASGTKRFRSCRSSARPARAAARSAARSAALRRLRSAGLNNRIGTGFSSACMSDRMSVPQRPGRVECQQEERRTASQRRPRSVEDHRSHGGHGWTGGRVGFGWYHAAQAICPPCRSAGRGSRHIRVIRAIRGPFQPSEGSFRVARAMCG